ncbi:hypothetical protein QAD02_016284 [Eretmocerus hayati]|uniref:Uncharacterized protein n=1 Tax=Eretmocerus hayati TaxID=131215 RepID=A0ACC2PB04_9HYME|nr:hypothetical protein QAD02_016284 [Eretmocerus hayati]
MFTNKELVTVRKPSLYIGFAGIKSSIESRELGLGRCNREKPPCKYFHPPQHLKDQLLINGRNHLALKNALMQQMGLNPGQPLVPGQVPTVEGQTPAPSHQHLQQQIQQQLLATHALMATNPYLTGMPQVGNTYSPYFTTSPMMPTIMGPADPTGVGSPLGVVQQTVAMPQKMPRSDRLEVCREFQRGACKRGETECRFAHPLETVQANEDGSVTVCMDAVKGRCNREPCRYFHPPLHLQAHIKATQSRASIATAAALPMTGAVSANAVPGGLQNANMASIELGKKRMRDSNDDLLMMDMKSVGSLYYDNFAFQGMVPYKRPAGEKSGVPVYQPTGATTYQQLMQLQQPFVPVSCEYSGTPPLPAASSNPAANNPLTSMYNSVAISSVNSSYLNSVGGMNYTMAGVGGLGGMLGNHHPHHHQGLSLDPASLAKEVAQKNYAKAIKLSQQAAISQQAAAAAYGLSPLNALSYTGVALNKQSLAAAAAAAAMPAPAHYAAMQSPYATMIPGAMQPLTAGAAAGMAGQPGVAAAAAAAAHAAANSGVIMQPYKKMKTT